MEALKRPLRFSEYLLLAAGIGILISQPWLDGPDNLIWILSKVFYFAGVILFIAKR